MISVNGGRYPHSAARAIHCIGEERRLTKKGRMGRYKLSSGSLEILYTGSQHEGNNMPATEILTTVVGTSAGKKVHAPTGQSGNIYASVYDWVSEKTRAGIKVQDVTSTVLVQGVTQVGHEWAAYEEVVGGDTLVTIFEITQ
jgi:hypothetical protein